MLKNCVGSGATDWLWYEQLDVAILDFSRVLELKRDFMAISLQRDTVYMKTGENHEA